MRNFLNFLKRKLFLYFAKWELSYISGTWYISESNILSSKNKKTTLKKLVIFRKMELSSHKPERQKLFILSEKQKNLTNFWPHAWKNKKPSLKKFAIFSEKKSKGFIIGKVTLSDPSRMWTINVRFIYPKSYY